MTSNKTEKTVHALLDSQEACSTSVGYISDALYVLGGKWKLALVFSLIESPKRFGELQKLLKTIGPKMLTKDLRELELNDFIVRKVYEGTPPRVIYEATPYSHSLAKVLFELRDWGQQHRMKIKESMRKG